MAFKGNVLLVDDEAELVEELKWQLEARSYNMYAATSAKEALDVIRKAEIDVLITDIRMPAMSGVELMRKTLELQPDIQCIIITGHADLETAVEAMRLGAVNFLCKPKEVVAGVLDAAINEALNKLALIRSARERQKELEQNNKELSELRDHLQENLKQSSEELRRAKLREITVEIMNLSLQYFEMSTGKTKIELCEESGIWHLTEDANGFVPKTMNRYLKIETLPRKKPYYRNVQKTGYYVLSLDASDSFSQIRENLKLKLDEMNKLLLRSLGLIPRRLRRS